MPRAQAQGSSLTAPHLGPVRAGLIGDVLPGLCAQAARGQGGPGRVVGLHQPELRVRAQLGDAGPRQRCAACGANLMKEGIDLMKAAIIGAGFISDFHADGYLGAQGVTLCAICDMDAEKARALAQKCHRRSRR